MGCGMSRYGMVDVTACGGYPSSSRKKLDEASLDSKPIHKKDGGDHHDNADAQNCRKSVSAPPRKSVSTTYKKTPLDDDPCSTPRMGNKGNESGTTIGTGETGGISHKDESEEEEEEDGGRLSSYDGPMWLNSPSFRDYCHRESDTEDNLKDGGHSDSEKDQSSSRGENPNASTTSGEALESKSSKKSIGSTLSRVFPNGSSMKQFLHISSHHHHHHGATNQHHGTKASGSHENHGKHVEKVD